jgi:hypothetical protein
LVIWFRLLALRSTATKFGKAKFGKDSHRRKDETFVRLRRLRVAASLA